MDETTFIRTPNPTNQAAASTFCLTKKLETDKLAAFYKHLNVKKIIIHLKDIKLKDIERKIKREIEELFFKPMIVYIDAMDKLKKRNEENKTS